MTDEPATCRRRLILLGASNLTRGLSTVVETARLVWNEPLEILAAVGDGRSFGLSSSVLGRTLPGIVECGLWRALETRKGVPAAALVTDIGNDVAYGATDDAVIGWLTACLDRLAGAEVILTGLPVASLESLSPSRFYAMRTLLFPAGRIAHDDVLDRARDLDGRIAALGIERAIPVVPPRLAWYGIDPIHIRRNCRTSAWREILSHWPPGASERPARPSVRRWLYLRSLAPEKRRLFGIERRCAQPAGQLDDGSTVALY